MTPELMTAVVPTFLGLTAVGSVVVARRSARAGWQTELAGIRQNVLVEPSVVDLRAIDESLAPAPDHEWSAPAGFGAASLPSGSTWADEEVEQPADAPFTTRDTVPYFAPLGGAEPAEPTETEVAIDAPAAAEVAAPEPEPEVELDLDALAAAPQPAGPAVDHQTIDLRDGTPGQELAWAGGRARVAGTTPALDSDPHRGLSVQLGEGWCWTRTDQDGTPVAIEAPGGRIRPAADASLLTVVDPDGTCFIAMVEGTAIVERPTGRLRLRAGALLNLAADGRFEVDEATTEELEADPIVAANRALDATPLAA